MTAEVSAKLLLPFSDGLCHLPSTSLPISQTWYPALLRLFAEVDGQSGGFAFVHGIDDDAGAEFGVAGRFGRLRKPA